MGVPPWNGQSQMSLGKPGAAWGLITAENAIMGIVLNVDRFCMAYSACCHSSAINARTILQLMRLHSNFRCRHVHFL